MPGTHSPNPVLSSDFPSYRADRAGPRMRGAPNFAARKERASARTLLSTRGNIGSPWAPLRGAFGVLDPAQSARCARPVFETKEGTMITLQDHIEELRAELRGCLTRRERAAVNAELDAAIAALKEHDVAADTHHNGEGG
jgi:hypothetical protein